MGNGLICNFYKHEYSWVEVLIACSLLRMGLTGACLFWEHVMLSTLLSSRQLHNMVVVVVVYFLFPLPSHYLKLPEVESSPRLRSQIPNYLFSIPSVIHQIL